MKLAWAATVLPCIAAIIQSFAPLWVFMSLILASMIMVTIGLALAQRKAKHQELIAQWDKVFGVPNDRAPTSRG